MSTCVEGEMQKFDLHMHTTYCDGNNTAEEMIKAAMKAGLETVGLSGHSFTPYDQSYCMSREGTLKYIEEVDALKARYAGRIRVLLGLELDYYADTDTSPYDYLIGSVHYMFTKEGRKKYDAILSRKDRSHTDSASLTELIKFTDWSDVDDEAVDIQVFAETLGVSVMDVAELYYETEADVIRQTDCDIIGHFDLITKFNEKYTTAGGGRILDTDDPRYISAWKNAIDRIFEDCRERYGNGFRNRLESLGLIEAGDKPVFEINHGAVAKGYKSAAYPASDQTEYIRSKGGVLICSSDAHRTDHIAYWKR